MISVPVYPRSRAGLMELVEQRLDQVESGLVVLETDLELDPGCIVEGIGRDAAGRPVLLLLVDPDDPGQLLPRLIAARVWLETGLPLLARTLALPGVGWQHGPRWIVVGFELPSWLVAQLAQLPGDEVEAYELRPFRVGSRQLVGALPRLGSGCRLQGEGGFSVPGGMESPEARQLCAHLVDLMERLEPSLQVVGDRYSRTFRLWGTPLATLSARGSALVVSLPPCDGESGQPGAEHVVASPADCAAVFDAVARRYLELAAGDAPPRTDASAAPASTGQEHGILASAPSSFDSLRRSVEDARHLSDQEYSILGQSFDDDG